MAVTQTTMCIACETNIRPEDLDAFGETFLEILNHGAVANMIAIGHRTGLFDALRESGPATSAELAESAGLNERYVREWLGAMTCGGIVTCDDTGSVFELPAAHAALLAGAGSRDCLAHLARYVSLFGSVEDQLADCFRNGGGVPYSEFPSFHSLMAEDSAQTVVAGLFDHILPLAPGITFALHQGIDVADIGCGRGRALLTMAAKFPNSRFTGWDLSSEAIAWATERAREQGLNNVTFECRDLSTFHEDAPEAAFDFVTAFDAIHDQARPDHVLEGIHRTLRQGGTFLMQDIGASSNVAENRDHPLGPLLYTISTSHCMTVSLAQPGGLGVGAMWGEQQTREFLTNAGFRQITRRTLEHDIQNYYYIISK